MITPLIDRGTQDDLSWLIDSCRVPRLRSMQEFAEAELVIPEGKYKDTGWRPDVLPYARLLFEEMTSGRWTRFAILGPVQGGKSFHGFVAPVLYHLFEMKEPVIFGSPTMEICKKKWNDELLPAIRAAGFKRYLPTDGSGSRSGWAEELKMSNGATLTFMSGRGGDETRSSATTRVVVLTEADKMDTAAETSREADPVSQLEARMLSYDEPERRFYVECTVSIPSGRIWTEFNAGSRSRIACPCPHCGGYVTPEREHLRGFEQADNKIQARRAAYFVCPSCEGKINDAQRREMNLRGVLVHRGQTIDDDGAVSGPLPETDTLGFRWNAFNNLFWSAGAIASKEWEALHSENDEEKQKELLQFYWTWPYDAPLLDVTPLDSQKVRQRFGPATWTKEIVPAEAKYLTMGVDVGKRVGWWILLAWFENGSGHVCDYGAIEIPSDSLGEVRAITVALNDFRDIVVLPGFRTTDGQQRVPDQVWIDARYQTPTVYAFIRQTTQITKTQRFRPTMGHGAGQQYDHFYRQPKTTNKIIKYIGEEYDFRLSPKDRGIWVVHVNADYYKSLVRDGLATPQDQPGAITLYASTNRNQHITLSKHFTAEQPVQERDPVRGLITRWLNEHRRANHYFDCLYDARAAAQFCGLRLVKEPVTPPAVTTVTRPAGLKTPDGRPFLVTER